MITLNKLPEQLAGISELYLIPVDNIASISGLYVYVNDLSKIYNLKYAAESAELSVEPGDDDTYSYDHSCFIPGRSQLADNILKIIRPHKLVVIYRENSGAYLRCGDQDYGTTLSWKHATEADPSGQKGYSINLKGDIIGPPVPVVPQFSVLE